MAAGGLFTLFSAAAQAQSFSIYGLVDTGIVKQTGSDVEMKDALASRLGFKGSEDLGGGLKLMFKMEHRLRLYNGKATGNYSWDEDIRQDLGNNDRYDWQGAANVGLTSNRWGELRVGRVVNLIARSFSAVDPFGHDSIAASFSSNSLLYSRYQSNTIRYDSPEINGLDFGISYTMGDDKRGTTPEKEFVKRNGNNGFGININYQRGPAQFVTNFQRTADSSNSYTWNLGGTYRFLRRFEAFLGYERVEVNVNELLGSQAHQKDWITGLRYRKGPHTVSGSFERGDIEAGIYQGYAKKYALGYTYNFSRRTSLYSNVIYIDSSNDLVGSLYNTNNAAIDSMVGMQIGLNHRF